MQGGFPDNDTLYGLIIGSDRLTGGSGDDLMFGGRWIRYLRATMDLGSDEITEDSNSGYDIIRIENEGNGFPRDMYYANGAIFALPGRTNPDLNTLKINDFANFEEIGLEMVRLEGLNP